MTTKITIVKEQCNQSQLEDILSLCVYDANGTVYYVKNNEVFKIDVEEGDNMESLLASNLELYDDEGFEKLVEYLQEEGIGYTLEEE